VIVTVFSAVVIVLLSGLALGKILVTNNPNFETDPAYYKAIANEMVREGNTAAAIANYEQSLKLREEDNVRSNLAVIYYRELQYSDAIRHLRALVASNPKNPSYHYDLAVNLVDRFRNTDEKSLDDLLEALDEYEIANELEPGYSNSVNNIAVMKKILQVE